MTIALSVGGDDDELASLLDSRLTACNFAATNVHEEISFSIRATDSSGNLIGGLTGWIWGYTSGINMMWIEDDARGRGVGSELLEAAEARVKKNGCRRIYVSSFSFQAPEFYRKNGYQEIARIPGLLADGVADVWFVKHLHVDTT